MNRMMVSPLKNHMAVLLACGISLALVNEISAGLIGYQPHAWSSDSLLIVREGQPLTPYSPATVPNFAPGVDYIYTQDTFLDIAIAHAGFAVGDSAENSDPRLFQHVYAYSIPEGVSVAYQAETSTGHQMSYRYDASQMQTLSETSAKIPNYFKITGNLDLNGSLLLAKSDLQGEEGYKGLLASFNVVVNKLTPDGEGGYKTKKVLKGTVELVGKKNGDVKIRTKGAIKKKNISSITETEDSFLIDFVDEKIPYKVKTKLGEEYILDTTIHGYVNITGSGTGAEIMFTPGSMAIPSIQETGQFPTFNQQPEPNNDVPEPATLLLFLSGLCSLLKWTKSSVSVGRQPITRNYRAAVQ